MRQLFLPTTDSARELWLKNFAAKMPLYATKYIITADEVDDIVRSAENVTYWLNFQNQIVEFNHKSTEFKKALFSGKLQAQPPIAPEAPVFAAPPKAVLPGIFERMASYAKRIKGNNSYDVADGKDLGIENPVKTPRDLSTAKPVISVRLTSDGKPEVIWKKNRMDAIQIMVDRGDGYVLAGMDTRPNFIDDFVLAPGVAAVWKYKAIYFSDSARVGQFSDEVTIVLKGEVAA